MLKKVGSTKLSYGDIKYDVDDWVDAKHFAPAKFDLVRIKTENKTFNGWHTGDEWFGLRMCEDDKVLYWKRRKEVY